MPMSLPRKRFSAWHVAGVAARAGVYVLWRGGEILYIGRARTSLRERLMEHYTRQAKPWDATHFCALSCEALVARETELLESVRRAFGALPRYNAAA